ncbi:MAG: hypothetical protein HRK26_04345 [Rickettsiaceae bacterium H1]|nr:hypothetical protein [Rickettsiaceae bacterium H1]
MKKIGVNINKSNKIINKKMFNEMRKIYEEKFAIGHRVKVSWCIAYISAIK